VALLFFTEGQGQVFTMAMRLLEAAGEAFFAGRRGSQISFLPVVEEQVKGKQTKVRWRFADYDLSR
jgi:hypothetical protein